MHRIFFRWRGIDIYCYPAMLYLGLVLGIFAGNYAARLARLDTARVFIATFLLLIPALVGARLFDVVINWKIYQCAPKRIWRRSEGGGALFGGLPLTLPISVPLLNVLQIPIGAFWDVTTFTILIGMIFGRFGCLLNGCCAGKPSDSRFAMFSPNHMGVYARRIPAQLLEALWATLLLLGTIVLWNRLPFSGALFLFALGGYALGRLALESMREQQDRIRRVSVHRLISLFFVASTILILYVTWPK